MSKDCKNIFPPSLSLAIAADGGTDAQNAAKILAQRFGLPLVEKNSDSTALLLVHTDNYLEVRSTDQKINKHLRVDYYGDSLQRRIKSGKKGVMLARAVGLKNLNQETLVVDATPGMGRDSFLLAAFGCSVQMIERSALVATLLADGIRRTPENINQRLSLLHGDSSKVLAALPAIQRPAIIILDPMHPPRKKSALVKLEMRLLRQLVGDDGDFSQLLKVALQVATLRVVVKWPRQLPHLPGFKPDLVYSGRSTRFDVYLRSNPAA